MIFAPPHYLSRVKGYSQLLLCEARKPNTVKVRSADGKILGCLNALMGVNIALHFQQLLIERSLLIFSHVEMVKFLVPR